MSHYAVTARFQARPVRPVAPAGWRESPGRAADGAHLVGIVHVIQFAARTLNQAHANSSQILFLPLYAPARACARMAHTKGRLF